MKHNRSRRNVGVGAMLFGAAALAFLPASMASAQTGSAPAGTKNFLTLDGKPPLILGHRGLPGLVPEETEASYDLAAALGTDALEEDLHLTKDCVLVARHNPWLNDNTNVAEVAKTNAAVAARKRTVPGVLVKVKWAQSPTSGPAEYPIDLTDPADPKSVLKSLIVDGEDHTNDWSITDFTMAELKNWIAGTTYDAANERPKVFNGKFPIISFQEVIDIAKAKSKETGRSIADLSGNQESDLEQCPGHRQWLRRARQPPARGCPDQDHQGQRPQLEGSSHLCSELRARQPEIYAQPRPGDAAGPAHRRQRRRLQGRQGPQSTTSPIPVRSTGRLRVTRACTMRW